MTALLPYLGVFIVMLALDWVWARYTAAIAAKRPRAAASWAVGTVLGGGLLTLSYVDLGLLALLPACAGSFVGTYLAVKK